MKLDPIISYLIAGVVVLCTLIIYDTPLIRQEESMYIGLVTATLIMWFGGDIPGLSSIGIVLVLQPLVYRQIRVKNIQG